MKISEVLKSKTKHFIGIFFSLICLSAMTFFVRPSTLYIITIYIALIGLLVFLLSNLLLKKRIAVVLAIGAMLFFFINYFAGFQVTNTLLLLSGIIGVVLLLK